jgi:hypothetical protein
MSNKKTTPNTTDVLGLIGKNDKPDAGTTATVNVAANVAQTDKTVAANNTKKEDEDDGRRIRISSPFDFTPVESITYKRASEIAAYAKEVILCGLADVESVSLFYSPDWTFRVRFAYKHPSVRDAADERVYAIENIVDTLDTNPVNTDSANMINLIKASSVMGGRNNIVKLSSRAKYVLEEFLPANVFVGGKILPVKQGNKVNWDLVSMYSVSKPMAFNGQSIEIPVIDVTLDALKLLRVAFNGNEKKDEKCAHRDKYYYKPYFYKNINSQDFWVMLTRVDSKLMHQLNTNAGISSPQYVGMGYYDPNGVYIVR